MGTTQQYTLSALLRSRFLSAYYVANVLVLASYAVLRPLVDLAADTTTRHQLKTFERQGLAVLAFNFILKTMKCHSVDHLLAMTFMYGKTILLALTYIASPITFTVALLEVLCVTVLTVQPMYDGPTRVEVLTPATMLTAVCTKPKVGHSTWLVVMFASWSSPCAHFAPAFANLSRKHCRTDPEDSLRFGALDLSLWPGLAGNYGMDLNATSSQLPTVVLFRDGQEVDRLPRKGAKGRWTAADVERVFDLKATDLAAKKAA